MKKPWNPGDLPYIITVIILGSLNHFVYNFSGQNAFAALFSPVNESTWEHLKLLFFPFLLATIWAYYKRRPSCCRYFCARLLAVLTGMLSIIVLFYAYTGIIGNDFLVMDILIFIVSVLISFGTTACYYRSAFCRDSASGAFAGWLFVMVCFFWFTCHPPNLPLFFSPV